MPNHVINILSFEGDKTKIRQMLEDIKDDECGLHSVDFNKIIPMPPGLDLEAGSCTQAGLDAYRDFIDVYTLGQHRASVGYSGRKRAALSRSADRHQTRGLCTRQAGVE